MIGGVVAQRARAEVLLESIARKGSKRVRERQYPAPRTKGIERRKAGSDCVTQSEYEMGTARLQRFSFRPQAGQMGYAKKNSPHPTTKTSPLDNNMWGEFENRVNTGV